MGKTHRNKPDRERIADHDVLQYDQQRTADAYNASDVYDLTMCKVICARVGMHEDFYYADGENIDRVMEEAVNS